MKSLAFGHPVTFQSPNYISACFDVNDINIPYNVNGVNILIAKKGFSDG